MPTLDKLRTSASLCLHVGDDPFADIQGAKGVGTRTAYIRREKVRTDMHMKIKRITELATLL